VSLLYGWWRSLVGRGGRLDDGECPVDEALQRQAGLLGTLGDAQRREVEDEVDAGSELVHERTIVDVSLDDGQSRTCAGLCFREVLAPTTAQVVQHDDLGRSGLNQLVDERRSDRSGAAGDEDALAGNRCRGSAVVTVH
jgi:hypothetical protein